jgi:hypothetical protein
LELLQYYEDEGDAFMSYIVMGDKTYVHCYNPEMKRIHGMAPPDITVQKEIKMAAFCW